MLKKTAIIAQAGRLPTYSDLVEAIARVGEIVVDGATSALSQLARGRAGHPRQRYGRFSLRRWRRQGQATRRRPARVTPASARHFARWPSAPSFPTGNGRSCQRIRRWRCSYRQSEDMIIRDVVRPRLDHQFGTDDLAAMVQRMAELRDDFRRSAADADQFQRQDGDNE